MAYDSAPFYLLGLDVGGTKIEVALLKVEQQFAQSEVNQQQIEVYLEQNFHRIDKSSLLQEFLFGSPDGKIYKIEIVQRMRVPTEREKGYESILSKMSELVNDACTKAAIPLKQVFHLGIGLPGAVDPFNKQMHNGNTQAFIGKNLIQDLKKLLPHPLKINVENDANCFALAEVLCGAGVKFFFENKVAIQKQIGIGIILGTGCGGGMVYEGELFRGKNGGALEVGHVQLRGNNRKCYCGRIGCSETVLAGTGISNSYFERYGERLKSEEIFTQARQGEEKANQILKDYQEFLLEFLVNLTNLVDPDYFVLGGGVAKDPLIYQDLEERLFQQSFIKKARPKIYQFTLGDSAGVIGAGLLAFQS